MTASTPAESNTRLNPASLLDREFNILSERIEQLSKLALEMDRVSAHSEFYAALYDLNDLLYGRMIRIFDAAEKYLYRHVEKLLGDPSSLAVIKEEQTKLLKLCNSIQTCLFELEEGDKREQLQSLILALERRLKRHIHLKDVVLSNELIRSLPEEVAERVYLDMSNFIMKGVHI